MNDTIAQEYLATVQGRIAIFLSHIGFLAFPFAAGYFWLFRPKPPADAVFLSVMYSPEMVLIISTVGWLASVWLAGDYWRFKLRSEESP